jgi:hypothetical protein
MYHSWGRGEVFTGFWLGGRPRRRWEDNIEKNFREIGIMRRTGFGWLRIGFNGGLL